MENSKENPNSLLQKIHFAFEEPDPKVVERLKDRELWIQKEASGRVHVRPPESDKKMRIVFRTEDPEMFDLFNDAASEVTKKWDGFHQIGAGYKEGLTAFELWKKPDVSNEELLEEVKKTMIQIATENIGS
ncbi:hypothetical protein A2363_02540 [Candidatus Gottesmanbacteria bacterium RIFOXYB1_FULL_47_11]|uniref:Uncharacterized protein n=1 Tax=Candidatus Gottesmanbacteria bacterium RIFOXYB1_FULL_47_11 TaxID=1798401 RepID=A0A1F6BEB0_9BACT|nr:MAG: hypothetical protein A2363_02540 [Candidatus Gottesmanbacteria bacterium RIFOXYB1_FULL_47_11]